MERVVVGSPAALANPIAAQLAKINCATNKIDTRLDAIISPTQY